MPTRYNTGNPIESTDVRDMSDNAKNFDEFFNSMSDSFTDRFGVDRQTMEGAVRKAGFRPASFDFLTGGSLVSGDRNKAVFNPAPPGDNNWYAWQGAFPKIISPNSTPSTSGGLGDNAWKPVTNNILAPTVMESIRRSYAEAGYNVVGTFREGFTIVNANDVGIDEVTGKGFTGPAGHVAAGTNPASGGFVDRSQSILRQKAAVYGTVSDIASGVYAVGLRITVTDRDMAVFTITSGGTPDGYGVLAAGTGKTAVIVIGKDTTIKSFGAKGDGITDDTAAIQAAVDTVWNAGGGVVYAPKGAYLVTATIDIFKGTAKRIQMKGAGIWVTRFITSLDIVVFQHAEFTTLTDFSVAQTGTTRTGRAFSTPTTKQAAYCIYERINATNFKFGIWWRFSLWSSLRDVTFTNCAVGVKASRNSSPDDQTNPASTGGWNSLTNGFFHNQNTFQNVLCDGGEVGIWGTFHGTTFDNITCQGQRRADGSTNVAAPVGTPGIGLWLQNDGNGTSTYGAQGNNIVNYYTEATRQPMVFEYVRVTLGAFFAQGGPSSDPYPQVIKVTGGEVNALGCSASGGDWFSKHLVLMNCRVLGDVQVGTVNGNVSSVTNSVWQQKISAPAKNFNLTHNGATTTAIEALAARSNYTVVVGALYDGYLVKSAQFEVYHYQGGLSRVMSHPSNTADITCTVSGDTLNLNTTGTLTYLIRGTVIRNNALGQYPYTAS